ncbi:MAG TPA: thiol reductase thioredoxin [Clostridiales bacterium UBA8960]|nr:thiol reductase thioredoxin [Clostridiales bacterium UBA8960]
MLDLDKDNFENEVLKASGIVVVDFWGEGCEPCKALMPDFESIASEYDGKATFGKLNTSKERRLAISQRVLGLPTVVLYKDGTRMGECTKDSANAEGIKALIETHL